ncbi:3-carboxy-cis,cis-muconate cycloisomerase [Ferrovibrio terrae]|uniref:3-carboxy-cis,cis-muconate cycloisomerase n=1 Tax=Ferrovibrio terrae TaxID=2594003 RepID=A0A516H2D6_9PROT|nr:3-carboxy-cis,cis-muconate cycloisomerase [Ferrovibrio terrae]QDO97946.1 3-carboxy-cis,cis-muconate cycloisomerase [Ferrovibrio terrae]
MTTQDNTGGLFGPLFHGSAIGAVFTDRAHLQGMLDFEAALARAEAKTGVIPAEAAGPIAAQCDAALYDLAALAEGATRGGNTAIPLVKALTAKVAARDKAAAGFVHWGATSQDAMDTGLVLQLRAAVALIEADLAKLSGNLATLAQKHRQTPMVGRTWLQHALPITFGLKVAGWLDAVERHRARIIELKPRLLVLQFGGAAGTLAALGDKGLVVAEALAADLKLALPATSWHGARDRVVEFGTVLALLTGTLGKMARDIALLMQTEAGEAYEPAGEGKGGSSTMPHKRNPVAAAAALAAATRVPHLAGSLLSGMVQEHERGLGGWHAEWQVLPELVQLSAGALAQMTEVTGGLEVQRDQMRANLDATNGLIMAEAVAMALGAKLGKQEAHHLIEAASKRAISEQRHLRDVLAEDKTVLLHLDRATLDKLFDPLGYTGVAAALIDRVLAARRT